MKMKKDDYYEKRGFSETRFLFDCLWRVPYDMRIAWFDRNIYGYLNDDHIETALRKALKPGGDVERATRTHSEAVANENS